VTMSASHIPHIQCVYQIGIEKHRMLDLFIQVPAIIRKRLSRRCKDVYETVRAHVSAEEVDEGTQEQVGRDLGLASPPLPLQPHHFRVRARVMHSVICRDGRLRALMQVAPLDLSGVDLSKPSDQKLRVEHRWTIVLVLKLAVPVLLSIVRACLLPSAVSILLSAMCTLSLRLHPPPIPPPLFCDVESRASSSCRLSLPLPFTTWCAALASGGCNLRRPSLLCVHEWGALLFSPSSSRSLRCGGLGCSVSFLQLRGNEQSVQFSLTRMSGAWRVGSNLVSLAASTNPAAMATSRCLRVWWGVESSRRLSLLPLLLLLLLLLPSLSPSSVSLLPLFSSLFISLVPPYTY
jgi:hypothetical protein